MIEFIINFLKEAWVALIVTMIVISASMIYVFVLMGKSFSKWKSEEGRGAAASALLGVGSIIAIAFIITIIGAIFGASKANADMNGTFFNSTSVFLGIDHTLKVSPQCVQGGTDDRLTSNLGIDQNIWISSSRVHNISLRYTHHSCVFGKDRNGYDGFGLMYSWTLFSR